MSSTNDLLKDISGNDATALQTAADAIGAFGEWWSVVGAVGTIIEWIKPKDTEILDKLNNILTVIQECYKRMDQQQKAQDLLTQYRDLDLAVRDGDNMWDMLTAILDPNHPPVEEGDKLNWIKDSLSAVNNLIPDTGFDDKFKVNYYDQIYYIDEWSGQIAPGSNEVDRGLIFCTRYVLPLYVREILKFLVVARLLDSDYQINYKETFEKIADNLMKIHDRLVDSGIVLTRVPNCKEVLTKYVETGPHHINGKLYYRSDWDIQGNRIYGAVECYSGYSVTGKWPSYIRGDWAKGTNVHGPQPTELFYTQFYSMYFLRTLRCWKKVYTDIKLPVVWDLIYKMKSLAGENPVKNPDLSWWSLREVDRAVNLVSPNLCITNLNFVQEVVRGVMSTGDHLPAFISVRGIAERIGVSPVTSLRELFNS